MSLQIQSVILAAVSGQIRRIDFRPGRVNVITGASNTGKSSILSIIEYCLGRSEFHIPEGKISESVAWYCVLYVVKQHQVLVAKPPPKPGKSTQSEVYLEAGTNLELPDFTNLSTNSNDDVVVDYFTRLLGVKTNLAEVPMGQSHLPTRANMKHTRFYLFQNQGTVASESILFHRQSEQFMPQAIKDTLPYFLGAYDDDRVKVLEDLRSVRRDLRSAERRLADIEEVAPSGSARTRALIAEAKQVGLVEAETQAGDDLESLRRVLNWKPETPPRLVSDEAQKTISELAKIRGDLREVDAKIGAAEEFRLQGTAFSREAEVQTGRLSTIGLLGPSTEQFVCPLCHTKDQATPLMADLQVAMKRLQSDLASVALEAPQVSEHVNRLREQREALRVTVRNLEAALAAAVRDDAQSAAISDRNSRAAITVGRISLFLESISGSDESALARDEVDALKRRVALLEAAAAVGDGVDNLESALSWITRQMTKWAEVLELEFSGQPYRFDLTRLTVIADRDGRPVPMGQRMGGGQNWLGCHLICLLSLHKFFIKNRRPVPGFLVLDQPTQVYFPPERYRVLTGDHREMNDEDTVAVKRLYDFLFSVATEMNSELQIIVLDHAFLDSADFRKALVEPPWRNGVALIPAAWG